MITEQQAQRCTAHLELARTAIDSAELRIVGAMDGPRPGLLLSKACAEIAAAASNLHMCAEEIEQWSTEEMEKQTHAAPVNGSTAGNAVVPGKEVRGN